MLITLLLTIIGSSIGGLLAIGTAWASVKRMIQRSIARHLSDVLPRDRASAIVLAQYHGGREKVDWLMNVITVAAGADENSKVLDIAGATQLALLDRVTSHVASVTLYDSKVAFEFMLEQRPSLGVNTKVKRQEGDKLVGDLGFADGTTFDVVVVIDAIHQVAPDLRSDAIRSWTRLVNHDGGRMVIVFEADPLSDVSQAGVIQGLFHRIHVTAIKALLAAEDMVVYDVLRYPPEFRVAVVARRRQTSIAE